MVDPDRTPPPDPARDPTLAAATPRRTASGDLATDPTVGAPLKGQPGARSSDPTLGAPAKIQSGPLPSAPTVLAPRSSADPATDPTVLAQGRADLGPWARGADPRTIGRYTVVDRLGEGGMGVVYRAIDPELDRPVAIKLLRPDIDEHSGSARLVREAQALAKLSHPNVVQVLEVGSVGGAPFLVMELVRGEALRGWQRAPGRTPAAILDAYRQAAEGLAAAHAVGLVHRDFKPDNVLVGDDGRVRVVDFGLARAGEHAAREVAGATTRAGPIVGELTHVGAILGTPPYMAPEQHYGEPATVRSDVFAFSVALHEAIFGERPHAGETLPELVHNIVEGIVRPPPPGPTRHGWIRAIVLRGVDPDPARRFASMREVIAALERDPSRRRRRLAALVGVGVALAAAVITTWTLAAGDPLPPCDPPEEAIAEVWGPREREAIAAALARGGDRLSSRTGEIADRVDQASAAWIAARIDACAPPPRRAAADAVAAIAGRRLCLDARLAELAATIRGIARADASIDGAPRAIAALVDAPRCDDPVALAAVHASAPAAALAPIVDVRMELGALANHTLRLTLDEVVAAAEAALPRADATGHGPLRAEARRFLAWARFAASDVDGATAAMRQALVAADEAGDEATLVVTNAACATMFTLLRAHDDAETCRRRAEAHASRIAGDPEAQAQLVVMRGNLDADLGKLDDALVELREAHARLVDRYGEDDVETVHALNNIGFVLEALGRLDEAYTTYDRHLALIERLAGPRSPVLRRSLTNMASVRIRQGDLAAARALALRAVDAVDEGPDRLERVEALELLVRILAAEGSLETAIAREHELLTIDEALPGPPTRRRASARTALGALLVRAGRPLDALAEFSRARAILAEIRTGRELRGDADNLAARAGLVWALDAAGRADEARAELAALLAEADAGLLDDPKCWGPRYLEARLGGRPPTPELRAAIASEAATDPLHSAVQGEASAWLKGEP